MKKMFLSSRLALSTGLSSLSQTTALPQEW